MQEPGDLWNLNIHYDEFLADLVWPGACVLDVGCGDGFLSARLETRGCHVVALDADAAVLDRARQRWAGRQIDWVHADILDFAQSSGTFDVVLSNAAIHHLPDTRQTLEVLAALVAPGGRLGIVGFARNGILDWPMSIIGAIGILVMNKKHHKWEHTAPIAWPPPMTYQQIRRVSRKVMPERSFKRLWLGRYFLTWERPRWD